MRTAEFSEPIRQSVKGIVIIFGWQVYQFIRRSFILFFAVIYSRYNDDNLAGVPIFYIILGVILVVSGLLVYAILKYLNFKFYITEDDFYLNSGILTKEETRISKSKIQNVYIKQNFLQQIINVVSLTIETAGDNKSEIEISALDRPQALRLKSELFSNKGIRNESKEIDPVLTEVQPEIYFKASAQRLLLEGISQNHLRSLAIIAAFFFGLFNEVESVFNKTELQDQISEKLNFEGETFQALILLNVIALILILLISVLFSIIKTFITNFNLEVIERQSTFEINKGLFNKINLSLTPSRVQNISIKTNRFKRYLGLYSLSVKQAMVNKKLQGNFSIVALGREQTDYLLKKLFKNYSGKTEKYKPDVYFKRILLLRAGILLGLLNLVMYLIFGISSIFINIILIPYAIIYILIKYRKAYVMIDDTYLTVGSGFFDTATQIIELHKVQSVEYKQNFFQKRRNVASIAAATSSKALNLVHLNEELAKSLVNFMLFKIESQNRDWM